MKIEENHYGFHPRRINSASKWDQKYDHDPIYPEYYDKKCHYLDALYATLVQLKPNYCLEIGTHDGKGSTRVFEKYLKEVNPDAHLITLDVMPCSNLPKHPNIEQVIVAPHHARIAETCGNRGNWFVQDDLAHFDKLENSINENLKLVSEKMKEMGIEKFDIAFIDGDHEEESFLNDIELCKQLTAAPHYLLLDDTKEELHPCCHIYHAQIKDSESYECYNFEDWNHFVGMSLVKSS